MEFKSVGLEGILVGKSRFAYADKETEVSCKNKNIRCYKDGDSYRFVYYKNRKAVSGIHFLKTQQGFMVAQTMFTAEGHRRKGYAREVFNEAKSKFMVVHSTNLSEDGKAFSIAVK